LKPSQPLTPMFLFTVQALMNVLMTIATSFRALAMQAIVFSVQNKY
jgi:hypothetical protein